MLMYGDYVAAKKIMSDKLFFLSTLITYNSLSSAVCSTPDEYLFTLVEEELTRKQNGSLAVQLIIFYLEIILTNDCECNPKINFDYYSSHYKEEDILYLLSLYYYISDDIVRYDRYANKLLALDKNENKNVDYYIALLKHNISEEENSQFLLEESNIDLSVYFPFNLFFDFFDSKKAYIKHFSKRLKDPITIKEE
jgi:hypothetical protein